MVDEELKEKMKEKIEDEEFGPADIPEYMQLFAQICNENEEIQEELDEDEYRNFVFHIYLEDAEDLTIKIEDGKVSVLPGAEGEWNAMLKISAENFAGLISGTKDGKNLYMNQELEAHGGLPAMIKFQNIISLVLEELED
ncbi:MAG: SCP2 sterol-binding domain-containing protein [Promethearchaeota archaeon]